MYFLDIFNFFFFLIFHYQCKNVVLFINLCERRFTPSLCYVFITTENRLNYITHAPHIATYINIEMFTSIYYFQNEVITVRKNATHFLGSEAVLGPQTNCSPPPIEQRVGRQRLRPGSGYLSVRVTTDGPTRVLQVLDIKERVRP